MINQSIKIQPADARLRSATELANLYGGVNFNEDEILSKLNNATQAKYKGLRNEFNNTEKQFYNRLADTQTTSLDSIRRANAQAIATGASNGLQASNSLSAILGLQNTAMDDSTMLAQERSGLMDKEYSEYARNVNDALNTSNSTKLSLGNLSTQAYGFDVQNRAAELSADAMIQQALTQLEGTKLASENSLLLGREQIDSNEKIEGMRDLLQRYINEGSWKSNEKVAGMNTNTQKLIAQMQAQTATDNRVQQQRQFETTLANQDSTAKLYDKLGDAVSKQDYNSFLTAMIDAGFKDPKEIQALWKEFSFGGGKTDPFTLSGGPYETVTLSDGSVIQIPTTGSATKPNVAKDAGPYSKLTDGYVDGISPLINLFKTIYTNKSGGGGGGKAN